MIWMNDTGAYFAGSTLGKHLVWPQVSPKKSWEGLAGGFTASMVLGFFLGDLLWWGSRIDWMGLALIVSTAGPLGDFFESYLKRKAGVKDSGNVLPGHGGFLDRLDSLLFTLPPAALYLMIRGVV
jgi:phosphatidate cytidylyltransferase